MTTTNEQKLLNDQDYLNLAVFAYMDMPTIDTKNPTFVQIADEYLHFSQEISSISCSKWRKEDKAFDLKIADLPSYRHQVDEILTYVQVIKLQGRLRRESFKESMEMI